MAAVTFEARAWSAAPPARVFAVLADAERWHEWAGPVVRRSWYEREGEPPPGGLGAIRRLGTSRVFSREEVVDYQPPHYYSYAVLSGLPVRFYTAVVELHGQRGGTRIVWRAEFEPWLPATGLLLRGYLRWLVGGFARRLARQAARP